MKTATELQAATKTLHMLFNEHTNALKTTTTDCDDVTWTCVPSTSSSAEHSATPAGFVLRHVKIPESSG